VNEAYITYFGIGLIGSAKAITLNFLPDKLLGKFIWILLKDAAVAGGITIVWSFFIKALEWVAEKIKKAFSSQSQVTALYYLN
jgi:hypothetical protein